MPIYHTLGQIPRKRHTAFRKPNGGLYAEELMGHEGFIGTSSLLYHTHPPTTVKSVRRVREIAYEPDPDETLRHRHFLTGRVKKGGSPTLDRIPLLFNADVAMLYVEPDEQDPHFYRNAQGDIATLNSICDEMSGDDSDLVIALTTTALQAALRKIDRKPLLFGASVERDFTHGQFGDERRMPRQDAQISVPAGNLNLRRSRVDHFLFRRDDLELESIGHQ